jgi:hypothetical protein
MKTKPSMRPRTLRSRPRPVSLANPDTTPHLDDQSTTTNIFTAGFSRNQIITYPTGAAASRAGINIPELLPGNLFNAPPDITITGYSNIGIAAPNPNFNNVYEWKDDATHVAGNHTLQAGFEIMRLQKFDYGTVNTQGAFTFNGNYTSMALPRSAI